MTSFRLQFFKMFHGIQYCELKDKRANGVDSDEGAHNELPHLDQRCLQIQLKVQSHFNGSNTFGTMNISSRQG